ncbi:MAG TPA: hypothetical protein VHM89_07735 [Acidimicrobiales bacterium]|nr:hypothetical protein [Acidimicrobiales bacterium]
MSDLDRNTDRWLSAVVQLRPVEERAPGEEAVAPETPNIDIPEGIHIAPAPGEATREVKVPVAVAQVARTKQFFANSGFEVHAPVGSTFSIGGKQSTFERFFAVELTIDESQLGSPVSTAAGERFLDLGTLPDEFKAIVGSVSFPPAVQVPGLPG